MTLDGPLEERAARGPRLPLVALLTADAISLSGNAMGFVAIPLRGRVLGATIAGAYLAIPAGAVLGGLAVEYFGVAATLFAIGVCYLGVTLTGVFNPTLRQMDPEPEPEPAAA